MGERTKYNCYSCGLNVWAKADVSLWCGTCGCELFVWVPMLEKWGRRIARNAE